jgi:hypothetical protein
MAMMGNYVTVEFSGCHGVSVAFAVLVSTATRYVPADQAKEARDSDINGKRRTNTAGSHGINDPNKNLSLKEWEACGLLNYS